MVGIEEETESVPGNGNSRRSMLDGPGKIYHIIGPGKVFLAGN
jgi:hypothetical protein